MAVRARQRTEAEVTARRGPSIGRLPALLAACAVAACAGGPPTPDWQANAKSFADDAVAAALAGDARAEAFAMDRARAEVARTGRPELMARLELMRCAAHVASLDFGPCAGFERLRADAAPAERAYAEHLAARALPEGERALLPAAQQRVAAVVAGGGNGADALPSGEDPLSRLVAAAVLFQAGKAGPVTLAQAADTASALGWRRPLLAWLGVQALRAEKAGDADEAARLRRRMALVTGAGRLP